MRGQAAAADSLWRALRGDPNFFGLLTGGKDVAVRVAPGADSAAMQQQVRFVLQRADVSLRRANPDARWWRLGPLTAAEVAAVRPLITSLGLMLEGDQVRFGVANHTRTRSFAFFAASGTPTATTLDDGGWQSSEAALTPADPPPRRLQPAPSRPGPPLLALAQPWPPSPHGEAPETLPHSPPSGLHPPVPRSHPPASPAARCGHSSPQLPQAHSAPNAGPAPPRRPAAPALSMRS